MTVASPLKTAFFFSVFLVFLLSDSHKGPQWLTKTIPRNWTFISFTYFFTNRGGTPKGCFSMDLVQQTPLLVLDAELVQGLGTDVATRAGFHFHPPRVPH